MCECLRRVRSESEEEAREEEEGRRKGAEVASKNKNPTLRMWGIKLIYDACVNQRNKAYMTDRPRT